MEKEQETCTKQVNIYADSVKAFFDLLIIILALSAILSAPAIWGYQIYTWLKYGFWDSISFADFFLWLGFERIDWIGLQRMIEWMPVSPFCLIAGIMGIVALASDPNKQDS